MALKFFCVILQLRLLLLDDEHGEEKQEGEGGDGPDNNGKDQSVHLRAKSLVSLKKVDVLILTATNRIQKFLISMRGNFRLN